MRSSVMRDDAIIGPQISEFAALLAQPSLQLKLNTLQLPANKEEAEIFLKYTLFDELFKLQEKDKPLSVEDAYHAAINALLDQELDQDGKIKLDVFHCLNGKPNRLVKMAALISDKGVTAEIEKIRTSPSIINLLVIGYARFLSGQDARFDENIEVPQNVVFLKEIAFKNDENNSRQAVLEICLENAKDIRQFQEVLRPISKEMFDFQTACNDLRQACKSQNNDDKKVLKEDGLKVLDEVQNIKQNNAGAPLSELTKTLRTAKAVIDNTSFDNIDKCREQSRTIGKRSWGSKLADILMGLVGAAFVVAASIGLAFLTGGVSGFIEGAALVTGMAIGGTAGLAAVIKSGLTLFRPHRALNEPPKTVKAFLKTAENYEKTHPRQLHGGGGAR